MSEFVKKPEKLSSAIYLITSFFSDQEPIKWRLRTLASEFISLGIFIKDSLFREQEAMISKIRDLVSEITSLLSVARNVGLVSPANYDLIRAELVKYLALFDSPINISDFFDLNTESSKSRAKEMAANRTIKDKGQLLALNSSMKGALKEFGTVSVKKNTRQSTIIAILKRKKEIMIKDILPIISGCSEKTIQRELLAMVRSGVLEKTGEKRWSRYSIARLA